MHRNHVVAVALLITALLVTGCATTQVTSFWKDPGYHKMPHKMLVIALAKDKDVRMAVEDEFVKQLNDLGLDVTSGTKLFPEHTPGNKSELENYLRDHGYDSFLLLRVVAEKYLLSHMPDSAPTLTNAYNTPNGVEPPPGSVVEQRVAMTEANLYDVVTQKLFWTAATRTTFEKVNHKLIADYVTQIVKKMQQSELLQ